MKINKPLCIVFAGAIGSSKTPIANYLSYKLNLPVFNNDAIRSEVIEDLGAMDNKIYEERRNERVKEIIENKISFIFDASIDRVWKELKQWLQRSDYKWFIISLDLSKGFLIELYKNKGYSESLAMLDKLILDHQLFVSENLKEINLSIKDNNFKERLKLSYLAINAIRKA